MFQYSLTGMAKRVPFLLFSMLFIVQLTPLESAEVKFNPNKTNVEEIILENDQIAYTLILDGRVKMAKAIDKKTGVDALENNEPLTLMTVRPRGLLDVGFHLFTVTEKKSGKNVSVTIREQSSYAENPLVVTQTFTLGTGPGLDWKAAIEYNDDRKPVPPMIINEADLVPETAEDD